MTKKLLFFLLLSSPMVAQVPFEHISTSTTSAERVAKFGVIDTGSDFLEITNSTQFNNSFIPSIWAHQQSDNRFALRLFATTSSNFDNGNIPIMVFRAELRNQLNINAPSGGTFPWGVTAANVTTRPLFGWENGNTQLMTLRSNGFLGLGTTSPTALFHTTGSIRHQNLPNAVNPAFMLGTDNNGNVFKYPVPTGTDNLADFDWLKPGGGTAESIQDNIYTNGNVGINVENPSAVLHTNGSIRFENLSENENADYMLGTDDNGNVFQYPVPTGTNGLADSDWLRPDGSAVGSIQDDIYTNGNVGINVQNPSAALHTNGSIRFENLSEDDNAVYMLGTDEDGNVAQYALPSDNGNASDVDWLKLDNSLPSSINDNIYTKGKVAINTNEIPVTVGNEDVSFYSLFVTGGILTEEVRVSLIDEWADYVFKKDYQLPTLKEIENHIKDKGHLINIPSEKEVKESGIELGEMNRLLLEKIEELTLHLIDMNNKIEEQQKEIDVLKRNMK